MKKSYATPVVAMSGNVVRETLTGTPFIGPEIDFIQKPLGAAAVGYYL